MDAVVVAVDGDTAVVRLDVSYVTPRPQEYRDLWVLRFADDGRVADFEEWAYWPGRGYSARRGLVARDRQRVAARGAVAQRALGSSSLCDASSARAERGEPLANRGLRRTEGKLTFEAPAGWEFNGNSTKDGLAGLSAAPNLQAWIDTWSATGAAVFVLADQATDPTTLLGDASANCQSKDDPQDFTNHGYTGKSQQWYQCDGQASFWNAIVQAPGGGPWLGRAGDLHVRCRPGSGQPRHRHLRLYAVARVAAGPGGARPTGSAPNAPASRRVLLTLRRRRAGPTSSPGVQLELGADAVGELEGGGQVGVAHDDEAVGQHVLASPAAAGRAASRSTLTMCSPIVGHQGPGPRCVGSGPGPGPA